MTDKHRILCIEDDHRLRRLLVEDLSEAGYEAVAVANARSGIEAFFNQAPSLVLCDIRMPGIDGFDLFECLQRIDAKLFGVTFIFLTALADRDNELRGRRLGADDYITKPVDYDILHEVIRLRLGPRRPWPPPRPLPQHPAQGLADWFERGRPEFPPPLKQILAEQFGTPSGHVPAAPPSAMELCSPVMESMPMGVVIVDIQGTVLYANESAAAILATPRQALIGLRVRPPLASFLRQHMASVGYPDSHLSAARLPIGPGDNGVTAIAQRAIGGRTTILLPIHTTARPVLAEILSALFGLTPSERSLATEMVGGTKLPDIAATRGVTIATIRTQVRAIYDKVGVTRQSDLVREMLVLQMAVACTTV